MPTSPRMRALLVVLAALPVALAYVVNQRIEKLEQRLEEQRVLKSETAVQQEKEAEAAKPEWERSAEFLAELDRLMADYHPTAPKLADDTDVLRCTTNHELATSDVLREAATGLGNQRRADEAAQSAAERAFEQNKWSQYTIDLDWREHVEQHPAVAAKFGCWDTYKRVWDSYWATPQECERWSSQRWRVRVPAKAESEATFVHTGMPMSTGEGEPELMKRIANAQLPIPARFTCRIEQASLGETGAVTLECSGAGRGGNSYIKLEYTDRRTYHIGDIVSVPLKDVHGWWRGVLYKEIWDRDDHWVISAKGEEVTLDIPATCPSTDEIVLAGARATQ